jgi:hypothetical protein
LPAAVRHLLAYGLMPPAGVPGRIEAFRLLHPAWDDALQRLWANVGADLIADCRAQPAAPVEDAVGDRDREQPMLRVRGPHARVELIGATPADGPYGVYGWLGERHDDDAD